MAKNLTLTFSNVLRHALKTGEVRADNVTVTKRIIECKKCVHLVKDRCLMCGCFISQKAGLKASTCPKELW